MVLFILCVLPFRGPVLCVAVDSSGEHCFSGGTDAAIRCWNLPDSNLDPYDSYSEYRNGQNFVYFRAETDRKAFF